MKCLEGKNLVSKQNGRFVCRKCGSLVNKKKQVCKPRKIKPK